MWEQSDFQHQEMLRELDLFPSVQDLSNLTLLICAAYDMAVPQMSRMQVQHLVIMNN